MPNPIKITVQAELEHYLNQQLYGASISTHIRKRRFRNRLFVPIIYILMGLYSLYEDQDIAFYVMVALALLWYIFYPLWEKGHYKRFYTKHLKEQFSNRFGKSTEVEITQDMLYFYEGSNKSEVDSKEIQEVIEMENVYLLRSYGNHYFIIPRDQLEDKQEFHQLMQEFSKTWNIPFIDANNWQWK